MVTIETENGTLQIDGRFSYTRQNADIGEVSKSNSNFTNSFNVRRDKNSTRVLKGLGLVGSSSNIPYQKTKSRLNINGVTLITDGWLEIKSVDNSNYKISVLDGNIDFWKAIEKVNLGQVDLHETKHDKTIQTIIDSWTNNYYKYLLADYNGELDLENNQFNADHLIPAIRESYIFERLFEYISFNPIMPIDIKTWLTYGKKTGFDFDYGDPTKLGLDSENRRWLFPIKQNGYFDAHLQPIDMNGASYNNGGGDGTRIYNLQKGYYKVSIKWEELKAKATFIAWISSQEIYTPVIVEFYINETMYWQNYLPSSEIENYELPDYITNIKINPYDIVNIRFKSLTLNQFKQFTGLPNVQNLRYHYLEATGFSFEMRRQEEEEIDFSDSLKKVSAKDYIKLIMHRYGLTLFYDNFTKNVKFMTIEQRLDADVQDLSEYYIERKDEKYTNGNYAQHNRFKHKYIEEGDDFNDSQIKINNENLPFEKELVESFTYSATQEGVFKMFEREPKKGDNDNVEIKYKPIDNRNFLQNIDYRNVNSALIYSRRPPGIQTVFSGNAVFGIDDRATFRYFIPKFWTGYENILNKSKTHKVIFRMSVYIFLNLDLKKRVYLKQEASYYLINSIKLKGEDQVEAELIKLD